MKSKGTWEAACVRKFVLLQIFLVMAVHFSWKITVFLHAAKRVEIRKMRVSPSLCHWNKIAEGYFVHRLTRQNKPCYFNAHLLLTPKKEYHLSSSHHCVEGSKFFIKVCHQSIVLSHSCLTGGTRWDHMFQIFLACAVLSELASMCHFCSYTVDRKLTLLLETLRKVPLELTYWQISIN